MRETSSRINVTIALLVATFLTAMDSTVVSTAMPTIVGDLGGIRLISWVFAVYVLTAAVTTPIWGKLADLFGRKIIFTVGTSLFLLGSVLSGASHSMSQLIWFRAFQGIGAGAVFPVTLTIIGDIYSFEERARIQGLFSAMWGISGILGPLVGGFFVEWLSWRWIFYINLPIGLASMVLVWAFLHERFERKRRHIDYPGAISFGIGMTALLYALLTGGQTYPWNSLPIVLCCVAALIFLAIFVWVQIRSPEPMVPLSLFRVRAIAVSNLAGLLAGAVLIGTNAYLPMWIQGILGHGAISAGLTLTPMSIGWPLGATIGGRLLLRMGSRRISLTGMTAIVLATLWLATANVQTPQWVMVAIMLLAGFGFGFAMTSFTVIVQSAVGWELRGAATASQQFVRSLGQTIGIAVFGTWLNRAVSTRMPVPSAGTPDFNRLLDPTVASHLPSAVLAVLRGTLATGLHHVFSAVAAAAVLGWVITWWLPRSETRPATPTGRQTQPANSH